MDTHCSAGISFQVTASPCSRVTTQAVPGLQHHSETQRKNHIPSSSDATMQENPLLPLAWEQNHLPPSLLVHSEMPQILPGFFSAGLSCAPIPAAVPTSKSHFLQLLFLLPVTSLSCSTEACCHIARIFLAFQSFVLKLFSLFFSQTWQMNVNRAAAHLHGILHLKLLFRLGFRNDKHQAADGGSKQKEPKRNEMAICHS